jgi:hypothetical protein
MKEHTLEISLMNVISARRDFLDQAMQNIKQLALATNIVNVGRFQ